jgi:hypothetical protein
MCPVQVIQISLIQFRGQACLSWNGILSFLQPKGKYSLNSYLCQGEHNPVRANFKGEQPKITLKVDNMPASCLTMFEAFTNYLYPLHSAVTTQLPKLLRELESVRSKAENAKIGIRQPFSDLKCKPVGIAIEQNMRTLTKMATQLKLQLWMLKDDLVALKETMKSAKGFSASVKAAGRLCSDKEVIDPLECYQTVHGPIECTKD